MVSIRKFVRREENGGGVKWEKGGEAFLRKREAEEPAPRQDPRQGLKKEREDH